MQSLTHLLTGPTLHGHTAKEGLRVLQLGPEGVDRVTMQGLQPYLQASGSQGLPGNLLHGHPSLQGELHLPGCIQWPSFAALVLRSPGAGFCGVGHADTKQGTRADVV